jgi:hypothetical protein
MRQFVAVALSMDLILFSFLWLGIASALLIWPRAIQRQAIRPFDDWPYLLGWLPTRSFVESGFYRTSLRLFGAAMIVLWTAAMLGW